MDSKQVAEHSWDEHFDGRVFLIKAQVFLQPFELDLNTMRKRGKYNTSVFIGGDWQLFHQFDYEPPLAELKVPLRPKCRRGKTGV
jgi:hypothetical protein